MPMPRATKRPQRNTDRMLGRFRPQMKVTREYIRKIEAKVGAQLRRAARNLKAKLGGQP